MKQKLKICTRHSLENIPYDENQMIITICNTFVRGTAMRIFAKQKCRRFTSAGISFCERAYHDRGFIRESAGKVSGVRFRFSRMVSIAIGVHEKTSDKQLSWKLCSTSFLPSNEIYFSAISIEKFLSLWIQICAVVSTNNAFLIVLR